MTREPAGKTIWSTRSPEKTVRGALFLSMATTSGWSPRGLRAWRASAEEEAGGEAAAAGPLERGGEGSGADEDEVLMGCVPASGVRRPAACRGGLPARRTEAQA